MEKLQILKYNQKVDKLL